MWDPKHRTVFVAGHRGMVGAAIVRRLEAEGCRPVTRPRADLELTDRVAVDAFFREVRPAQVYLAAAKVGGIRANDTYPADFIYENLMIEANVVDAACRHGVERLLFLGSSCIYPREAPQPMKEEVLLKGPLEPTNEPYAVAKIAGIKLCESYNRQHGTDFRSLMPTNLYGPGDRFDLETSHVIPALIRKFHEARERGAEYVEVWGTGRPRREFLYVDDLAEACVYVMGLTREAYESATHPRLSHLNVGVGRDLTVRELAEVIREVVGFQGAIRFNAAFPEGAPRKLLDASRLTALGWQARMDLRAGLEKTYQWFLRGSDPETEPVGGGAP